MALQISRLVAVLALLCVAAALATPKGRLPLALRGLQRLLRQDRGLPSGGGRESGEPVSGLRRLAAFALVLIAVAVALVIV